MTTSTLSWPAKAPVEVLDYSVDWTTTLAAAADTLSTVVWTVPAGLTLDSQQVAGAVATVWISGGTAGTNYIVICTVTTAGGRTLTQRVLLSVQSIAP